MHARRPGVVGTAALAAFLVIAGGGAADADTLTTTVPCSGELLQLHGDVVAVPITGGKVDKERAGLVKLVEDTSALAEAGKTSDAIVKLTNLQTKVDDLASAERITAESAALLTTDTAAATTCLSGVVG